MSMWRATPAWALALALTLTTATEAAAEEKAGAGGPVTVFVAKKVVTMDPGWPEATAVAVAGGKVLSVGSLDDLKPWLDRDGRGHTVDTRFADKVLFPGFVEPHGHPLIGGTALTRPLLTHLPAGNPYGPPFPGVKTKREALGRLKGYVAAAKSADETVLAWGYDVVAMGGGHLDRGQLDAVSPTQPVLVWDASEHFVYANTPALAKYGVTRDDTKTVPGVVAGPDGEPNGQFLGATAASRILVKPLEDLYRPEVALRNVKFLLDLSRRNGITTTSEMAFGAVDFGLEKVIFDRAFNAAEPGPLRCVVVTDATAAEAAFGAKAIETVAAFPSGDTDRLMFNGVKFFADDSFLSLGMVMENPGYTDGRAGLFVTPPGAMVAGWGKWWDAGFHVHVHTNGNGGNRATVDALAGLLRRRPRFDHRFTLEHYGESTPEMARRLARLGGVASVNPYYLYHRSELNAPYVGSDRAYTAARLKTLVDAGVPTSLHADSPVAPPFPLEEVWVAVNRFGLSGAVRGPGERVGVHQALKMITTDAAFTLGVDDKVGSLAAGKFADFTVLDADPHDVPPETIRDIRVWGTVVGGTVFPASEIRGE